MPPKCEHRLPLAALGLILAITAGWWALALWPPPAPAAGPVGGAAAWLLRARAVCFGTAANGLPDSFGWLTLIGQPILMLSMLFALWGEAVAAGLRALSRRRPGRVVLTAGATLIVLALAAAGARVATAANRLPGESTAEVPLGDLPRLDRPAPPLDLVDQHGERLTLARFRGRPVLVTFAYAHCETVCPLVVRDVLEARELAADLAPAVVVVTLDPWRDPPARLPAMAERWSLPPDGYVVSGDTAAVAGVLDGWNVARQRDLRTGMIAHATLVYLLGRDGRIAYAVSGAVGPAALAQLARKL